MKHRIVLYNPRAVFYAMPLALIAVGSRLDPAHYDVKIIDGRIEPDPANAVLAELDDTLCLGVTVLTGAPIRDALVISRAARARKPDLPIVWGGWHPSLFPTECLDEASVDVAVVGQGEDTFAEIAERLANGESLDGIPGCVHRTRDCRISPRDDPTSEPPRPLRDVNHMPAANYDLIDVEKYFVAKKVRQLDYISSQGCRFRCTFCADPSVYKRGWYGLTPSRVAEELERLWMRYHFTDVGFQDETFFSSPARLEAIADEFIQRGFKFTWTATLRADQGSRLDGVLFAKCKRSGLRRVMIGVESGSPQMLDWMKKDINIEHVFDSAKKCLRNGIDIFFNFIVGFPNEPDESVLETLRVAKELRAQSPNFKVEVFYFKPYPGNEIADALLREGYQFPRTLEEWADFDYVGSSGPWVTRQKRDLIERFKFYQRIAWSQTTPWRAPVQMLARWRCERDMYAFPIEKTLVERIRQPVKLS